MNDEIMITVGTRFYSFDGRILEIFGGDPIRFHIRNMYVHVTGPDRKGKRVVEIGHGRPDLRGACHIWRYTAAEWEQAHGLAALLEAVQAAIDSTLGHRTV
ncbi:hypothetical protein P8A22_00035 [Streptomyces laculatispora]|uniref:Uncharacterized protein n=1 Tax=Streptomyces laculatispora TaxID=887464 RepID=A0ABY9HWC3_9ACTN|nr:hypothetical protein [Streptomyces laculatispora]WLQ38591.1 hypothetical protein P8A22_00035 [Streptomyces laculatispora]